MSSLIRQTEKFIQEHGLFSLTDTLFVAVSGGVDSICLVHILKSLGHNVNVAHCNFGLRGRDSDLDEGLCKKFANELNVSFFSKKFQTTEFAKEQNISIQMAARELRYSWFEEVMQKRNIDKLVTAHHINDQIETILYNLVKGTGIAGLRGMPFSNERVVRPFIFTRKADILNYARENKLEWREDESNQEDKYHRNRIRNTVIPELENINPGLIQTFANNIHRFRSLEALLSSNVTEVKSQYWKESREVIELKMDWFDYDKGGLIILEELLKPYLFSYDQIVKIASSINNGSGNSFKSEKALVTIDRKKVFISFQKTEKIEPVEIHSLDTQMNISSHHFTFEISSNLTFDPEPRFAFLDYDKIKFPLIARNWKEGDRFSPLGMKGQKKISDFMIDAKIPVNLKEQVVVFESDSEIAWVAGQRISDHFKITAKTRSVFIIKMSKNA